MDHLTSRSDAVDAAEAGEEVVAFEEAGEEEVVVVAWVAEAAGTSAVAVELGLRWGVLRRSTGHQLPPEVAHGRMLAAVMSLEVDVLLFSLEHDQASVLVVPHLVRVLQSQPEHGLRLELDRDKALDREQVQHHDRAQVLDKESRIDREFHNRLDSLDWEPAPPQVLWAVPQPHESEIKEREHKTAWRTVHNRWKIADPASTID